MTNVHDLEEQTLQMIQKKHNEQSYEGRDDRVRRTETVVLLAKGWKEEPCLKHSATEKIPRNPFSSVGSLLLKSVRNACFKPICLCCSHNRTETQVST